MVAAVQEREGDFAVAHAFRYGVPSMHCRDEGVEDVPSAWSHHRLRHATEDVLGEIVEPTLR